MADIVLRNLDDRLAQRLRQRASRHGRSTVEELRQIVRAAVVGTRGRPELKKIAQKIRALSADRHHTPAEELIRESRDGR